MKHSSNLFVPPTVVVGVGAGIASYKVVQVVRDLRRANCNVYVIPTIDALNFVGEATWQEISENPVGTEVFHGPNQPSHIDLARRADLILVAPCTANLAARLRAGLADDLLTATILAADAPKILVPAMHTNMWTNPATAENMTVLAQRGFTVIPPESGALSSGDQGLGRLPDPQTIVAAALEVIAPADTFEQTTDRTRGALSGKNIVITSGGTLEPLDPVRYLGNRSSGRQGTALAKAALEMGADVTLLAANIEVPLTEEDPNLVVIPTMTAREMNDQVQRLLPQTDILIMAAAVADYRPEELSPKKIKKNESDGHLTIRLVENPDILKTAANSPQRPSVVIGFAAETGSADEVLALGQQKAARKGADLLAINQVGEQSGFGDVDNTLWVVDQKGQLVAELEGDKDLLARELLRIAASLTR